jgi:hypothetical protein
VKRMIQVTVNGERHTHEVEPRLSLVHYLRDVLSLTGTHVGCETSLCGACTVVLNGQAVKSCAVLAVQVDGGEVLAVEGLEKDGTLHPLQEGFREDRGMLALGARTTHYEVESSALVPQRCRLLAACAGQIGDVQVRTSRVYTKRALAKAIERA